MRYILAFSVVLVGCDPVGKGEEVDEGEDTGTTPEGADAVWYGEGRELVGSHLSGAPPGEVASLAVGSQYGSQGCPDSGIGGCYLEPSQGRVLRFLQPGMRNVAGTMVAHLAAAQAVFVEDCTADGIGELLAGMGGERGAILIDGRDYSELATYGAAPEVQFWVSAIGTGNSLSQGAAVIVQKSWSEVDGPPGLFFFQTERRGALELSDADASYYTQSEILYGAGVGDLDGDGVDDLAVGLSRTDGGCDGISVSFGPFEGSRSSADDAWCVREVGGAGYYSPLPLADLDMDGHLDLLARGAKDLRLFRGPIQQNLEPADARVSIYTGKGIVTALDGIGDFNGDGMQDLGVGIPDARNAEDLTAGQVYVFYSPSGSLDIDDWDGLYRGIQTGDNFGETLAGVGDINADGRDDLAVGAPGVRDFDGAVYLFLGE